MQSSFFFLGVLFASVSVAIPSPDTTVFARSLGLCKSPSCISQCPDGTKYDCCVTYIRDPCADHKKCKYEECICECTNVPATYLCHANYLVNPCSEHPTHPLPTETAAAHRNGSKGHRWGQGHGRQ